MFIKKAILISGFFFCVIALLTDKSFTHNVYKTASFPVDSSQTRDLNTADSIDAIQKGKQLYENKCQTCHPLFEPEDFTSKDWKNILGVMSEKSKLTSQEDSLIIKYLSKNSKK